MTADVYDLVVVGGGLAGSALAKQLADRGAAVLVLERERQFRDRVRGEAIQPWGIAEARSLGLYKLLLSTCAQEARWLAGYAGGTLVGRRDLVATTSSRAGFLDFYHPDMQEVLLSYAEKAGARIWRGATVTEVTPGSPPRVSVQRDGHQSTIQARLVVGADGRESKTRRWGRFALHRDPPRLLVAGALLAGMSAPEDTIQIFGVPTFDRGVLYFPLSQQRGRVYFITARRAEDGRLNGARQKRAFVDRCLECGLPAAWFSHGELAGPLATFEGAEAWAEHPYRDGVVLVGDAAAACDPSFGCGLALSLRDVRVLRDLLLATDDWDAAAHEYAEEHDKYFRRLHTIEAWLTEVRYTPGPEADRTRAHALPNIAAGLGPDLVGRGPDNPVDEAARLEFLGY